METINFGNLSWRVDLGFRAMEENGLDNQGELKGLKVRGGLGMEVFEMCVNLCVYSPPAR